MRIKNNLAELNEKIRWPKNLATMPTEIVAGGAKLGIRMLCPPDYAA